MLVSAFLPQSPSAEGQPASPNQVIYNTTTAERMNENVQLLPQLCP
jgi:hypothetical protein